MKRHSVQVTVPHSLSSIVGDILREEAMQHPFLDWEGHEASGLFMLFVPNDPVFSASMIHRITCKFQQRDVTFFLMPTSAPMQV